MYNEEDNVDEFFRRLAVHSEAGLLGVVVVDDGSRDQTVSHIKRLFATYPVPIRLVRLSRNFGHQQSVIAGCNAACDMAQELGAEWIGVIDGDLQDRPEDFALLFDQAHNQDVVHAVRAQRHDGWIMRTFAPIFYNLLSRSSNFPIPRNSGTFSIIRLPVARTIVESADSEPYFPGLRAWAGFRQKGVALDRQARASGTSKVALRGLIRLSLRAILLYSEIPLKMFFVLGLFLMLIMGLAGAVVVFLRLIKVIDPSGFTTLFIVQIASLGVNLFFMGVLAFMINRVKHNSSRQRAWLVMEETTSAPAKPDSRS